MVNAWYVFYRDPFSRALARASVNLFDATVERCRNGVPKMKEGIFFKADVDEHRLQTHLDVFDFTLVNAAYDVPGALTFNTIFFKSATLEQSHTGLEFLHAQDELVAGLA